MGVNCVCNEEINFDIIKIFPLSFIHLLTVYLICISQSAGVLASLFDLIFRDAPPPINRVHGLFATNCPRSKRTGCNDSFADRAGQGCFPFRQSAPLSDHLKEKLRTDWKERPCLPSCRGHRRPDASPNRPPACPEAEGRAYPPPANRARHRCRGETKRGQSG